jgi:hypothetical protein
MDSSPLAPNPSQISAPGSPSVTWIARPWEDKEVSRGVKFLIKTLLTSFTLISLIAACTLLIQMGNNLGGWVAFLVFAFGQVIVYLVARRYLSPATQYRPSAAIIQPDRMGEPFKVRFQYTALLIFPVRGKGTLGFDESAIQFEGLVHNSEGDPIYVNPLLPYNEVILDLNGRTIGLTCLHADPSFMKIRLGTDDGERFYRELALHLPNTVASFRA